MFDDPLNGGNGDDRIDSGDGIFSSLGLWLDGDRDGRTDPGELLTLGKAGIGTIALDYTDNSFRDAHGNVFQYSAPVRFTDGRSVRAWMVYFNA